MTRLVLQLAIRRALNAWVGLSCELMRADVRREKTARRIGQQLSAAFFSWRALRWIEAELEAGRVVSSAPLELWPIDASTLDHAHAEAAS